MLACGCFALGLNEERRRLCWAFKVGCTCEMGGLDDIDEVESAFGWISVTPLRLSSREAEREYVNAKGSTSVA